MTPIAARFLAAAPGGHSANHGETEGSAKKCFHSGEIDIIKVINGPKCYLHILVPGHKCILQHILVGPESPFPFQTAVYIFYCYI